MSILVKKVKDHRKIILPRWSCLSNLLVFEEAVTHMMGDGHIVDVIYLDFGKAVDTANLRFLLVISFGLGDVVVHTLMVGSAVHY